MSISRFNAVEKASNRKAVEAVTPEHKVSEYYGENVFNRKAMQKYLSKETYKALTHAIDNGTPIDREIANHVAAGMRMWALEKGVTHYTHWFQPLTDGTAEKHDAFVEHDGNGGMIEEFSGKLLVQQEPDASSFPNGGLRNTFEARGYSAWDPSSPAFIVDDTLCIPTVFIAYTGEALDYKTPLIRSIEVLGEAAKDVYRYFDEDVNKIITYLGWEQEYFLVDEDLYSARPDLSLTERTLLGHESALGFGQIPELLLDNTDRNRTSPFAFTGNRFEFRAPGSSVNCGSAMLALNSAVAYQLQQFKKDVEALQAEGKSKEVAIFKVLKAYIKESKPIRFDGNGYSDEWKEEAAKRGLDCQNSVPLQYDAYLKPESIEMFTSTGVLTQKELEARNEVKWEVYIKKVQIEARVLGDLSLNHIIPVAVRYQSVLLII